MAKQLTALAVQKMRPGRKRIEIRDGGCRGLILVVHPSGHKSWAMRFRNRTGGLARLTLGVVDQIGEESSGKLSMGTALTLAAARQMTAEINRQRALGQDVIAARQSEKLQYEDQSRKTFDKAATDFVQQHVSRKTRRWQYQARLLGLRPKDGGFDLIPQGLASRWSSRAVGEIDGDDIFILIDEVRERGVPGISRRNKQPSEPRARTMFATLSKMFAWLLERRRIKFNPCTGVHKPKAPKSRDRVLTDTEIVRLWSACNDLTPPFGHAVKLLLLTGCRLNEVARMTRSEVSDDLTMWTITGDRTKNHRTHVVPLPPAAREILADLRNGTEFMFTTNGRSPISGWSKTKRHLDAVMRTTPWRIHDLRRTCATGMAEIGIAPHIVEACLNHISGAKAGVAGTYNRAAYANEKRSALERWSAHIFALTTDRKGNVLALQRGTAA